MKFSKNDLRWQNLNKKLERLMTTNDFFGLGTTYYEMAKFIENEGKDPSEYRKQGFKMKVLNLKFNNPLKDYEKSDVVDYVQIICAPDSCDTCKQLKGEKISLKDAKVKEYLPVEKCSHLYGCRCVYVPEIT